MLSKHVDKQTDEWAYCVTFIQFAYNTSTKASACISPYEALSGRMTRLPLDTTLPFAYNRTLDIKTAIEDNQILARAAIAESRQDAVRRNTHSNVRVYQAGNLVSVHLVTPHAGEPDKLQSKWQGPCTVLRQISPVAYEVHTLCRRKSIDYFKVDKLKPYVARDEPTSTGGETSVIPALGIPPLQPFERVTRSRTAALKAQGMITTVLLTLLFFVAATRNPAFGPRPLCDCARMRGGGFMDSSPRVSCKILRQMSNDKNKSIVKGKLKKQYTVYENDEASIRVEAYKCFRWYNIRHVRELRLENTYNSPDQGLVYIGTECWSLQTSHMCDGKAMEQVENAWRYSNSPEEQGEWEP